MPGVLFETTIEKASSNIDERSKTQSSHGRGLGLLINWDLPARKCIPHQYRRGRGDINFRKLPACTFAKTGNKIMTQ